MAMNTVINTNMMALTAHRNLATVGNKQAKANQRLSSGKKINSAADDAAGLAISEKMKAQIKGLDMASKNSEDAISMLQTAEGSLSEVNNMLNRVRELTVQAGNDTNQTEDRQKIAEEVAQLMSEINATTERTEFNEKKLIDGSLTDTFFQIGSNGGQSLGLSVDSMNVDALGLGAIMNVFGVETANKAINNGKTEADNIGVISNIGGVPDRGDQSAGIAEKITLSATTVKAAAADTTVKATIEFVDEKGKNRSLTVETAALANNTTGEAVNTAVIDAIKLAAEGKGSDAETAQSFLKNFEIANATSSIDITNKTIGKTGNKGLQVADSVAKFGSIELKAFDKDGKAQVSQIANENEQSLEANMKTEATLAGTFIANQDVDVEITYIDESGQEKTKKLSVAPTGTGASNFATALKDAINGDNELSALVTAEVDANTNDKLIFTANGREASIQNISYKDTTQNAPDHSINSTVTADSTIKAIGKSTKTELQGVDVNNFQDGDTFEIDGQMYTFDKNADGYNGNSFKDFETLNKALNRNGIEAILGAGDDGDIDTVADNMLTFNRIKERETTGYRVDAGKVSDSGEDYSKAIDTIDKALSTVTTQRSKLGANQNRLEYTINNLNLSSENLNASRSRIEDTDMAKEMMNLTAANVLQQAATSMLAQANQGPNKITQLLG